ncbi:hypothetical protein HRbin29_00973 [bacterium HR29]|mgnify:CR=1 FL=1|jgi:GNAT superfamily N-acetyltransferase|nr:hypothetical protein HRbin29_00973 [bacterium HR29]
MTVVVRPAGSGDAPGLYVLWQAMLRHYASVDRRVIPSPVSEREFAEALDEILANPYAAAFVAEDEGTLVGFVSGGIESAPTSRLPDRHLTIGHFYVAPAYRGLGIGRQLFRAIAEWGMRTEEIHHFEMTVLEADREAREFWSRLGFTPFIQRLWAPLSVLEEGPERP